MVAGRRLDRAGLFAEKGEADVAGDARNRPRGQQTLSPSRKPPRQLKKGFLDEVVHG